MPSLASLHIRFPRIGGFPSWRLVQYYIMHISRLAVVMWRHRADLLYLYLFMCFFSFLLPFSSLFFFVFTESLCSGQNICVHLCVCPPLTWKSSSSFIDVEPPRLSKQSPALNGWLYLLLWSDASDLFSRPPTKLLLLLWPIWLHT